jgi:hypothetical protein
LSGLASPSDFARTAREPGSWLSQATTLSRAAALVYDDLDEAIRDRRLAQPASRERRLLMGPFMLLSGMAIENLLKSVLILRDPSIATNTAILKNKWPGRKDGHGLEQMAEDVALSLSAKERQLLKRLEIFVRWGGRYPVALSADAYRARRLFRPTDRDAIDTLSERLVAIVESERAARKRRSRV